MALSPENIQFIQRSLPKEFNKIENYEEFFIPKMQIHAALCSTTIATVKEILDPLIKRHINRFFCRIDDSNSLKSPASIVEKLRRESEKAGENPPCSNYKIKYTPENFDSTLTDLARFRVVCNFLSDVFKVAVILTKSSKLSSFFNFSEEKDTIHQHKRASGERSIKFILEYKSCPGLFIEIQVMTQLQEAWDKKDHYLVYEKKRSSIKSDDENFPTYLDSKMFAMAELLYVADNYFDQLRNSEEEDQ